MAQIFPKIHALLEKHEFDFENLIETLKCVICNKVLKNANQTSCGCKACEKCIRVYLQNGPNYCPSKQKDCANVMLNIKKDINQDNATNKEIGNLIVKCPSKSCKYSNSLRNMVDHVESCEFREVTCEKCDKSFLANGKMKHDQNECEMRNVKCPHCNIVMISKNLNSIHLNPDSNELCFKFISVCPNDCSLKTKVNLKDHLEKCENKKLVCPFHSFHCEAGKMTKEKLSKHIEEEFCNHISSLVDKIKNMESQIERLTTTSRSNGNLVKELLDINRTSVESRIKMENKIKEFKTTSSPTVQTIVEKSVIFRNGSYIWKFSDFESRRLDAENAGRISITSDPFYTSEFGYKMCLRIYPNGDGVGKSTHLSVFFAIMKGDYDDLLTWPFKQKVTLSIFDLETGTKHHSDTFKPDSRSACYQKPNDECNIASGSPKFILLSLLTSNDSIYCRNDTIFLKISVDTVGMAKP